MVQQEKEVMQVFQHGNEAIFPMTAFGPSLYGILEGAWMLPMLLKGIRSEIWNTTVEAGENHPLCPVTTGWLKLGLIEPQWPQDGAGLTTFPLTEAGQHVVACTGLLEYEFSMMEQQLNGSLVTDPVKYAKLREGLAAYSQHYLPDVFGWLETLVQPLADSAKEQRDISIMDYCGGKGQYLTHLMNCFEDAACFLVDKRANEANLPHDAVRYECDVMTQEFHEQVIAAHEEGFDLIIMSECLHCVDETARRTMIGHAYNLLRLGGTLVILEQFPNMRLDWRLFDLSHGGGVLSMEKVAFEVQALPFKPAQTIQAISHFGIAFTKETPEEE